MRVTKFIFGFVLCSPLFAEARTSAQAAPPALRPVQGHKPMDYPESFPIEMRAIDATLRSRATVNSQAPTDWVYLIVYKPTLRVDLSSPAALYRSIYFENLSNIRSVKTGDTTLGHFETVWSCARHDSRAGSIPEKMSGTGHTGELSGTAIEMIMNGGGMTPLFVNWKDGILEPPNRTFGPDGQPDYLNVSDRLISNAANVQMIAAAVSPEECRRVAAFYEEFNRREAYKTFGLYANPARFEGGVCWSTARAGVARIPALAELFRSFYVSMNVPRSLMGESPMRTELVEYPPELRNKNFAYLDLTVFGDPFARWNDPTQEGFRYETFDFQEFRETSNRGFAGCATSWCQEVDRRGGRRVTLRTTRGFPVSTVYFDAR